MQIPFTKMHGLGNDFMLIDMSEQQYPISADQVRIWGDRHRGIGFDQLLIIDEAPSDEYDFAYRIYNADGEPVEQCGNGARCFAKYVFDNQMTDKISLKVKTIKGDILLTKEGDQFLVDMGAPKVNLENPWVSLNLEISDKPVSLFKVDMGNPHAVMFVDELTDDLVHSYGPVIQADQVAFPEGVNVGFCKVIDSDHIELRVFERGVGETQACGSGACAAAVAAMLSRSVASEVKVQLLGGSLNIRWNHCNPTEHLMMKGDAATVYQGVIG